MASRENSNKALGGENDTHGQSTEAPRIVKTWNERASNEGGIDRPSEALKSAGTEGCHQILGWVGHVTISNGELSFAPFHFQRYKAATEECGGEKMSR